MILEVTKAVKNDPWLTIVHNNGNKELVFGTIKSYEALDYVRISRDRLVHKSRIKKIEKGKVYLKGKGVYKIPRRKIAQFAKI